MNSNNSPESVNNSSSFQKNLAHARVVVQRLVEKGIDVTAKYDDWVAMAFALSNLGEDGRDLFHQISRLNEGYVMSDCDNKYSNCLRSMKDSRDTKVSLGTFFKKAADYGVDISLPDELKPKVGRPSKNKDSRPGIVKAHEVLQQNYQFRYNVIACQVEYRKIKEATGECALWKRIDDRDFSTIFSRFRLACIGVGENELRSLLQSVDVAPDYNPFLAYFESLEPWDGATDYISQLFDYIVFESEEDRSFCLPLLKKWFINIVALVLRCANDNQIVPVLVGPQRIGKTYFAMNLLPSCLREYIHTLMPGDDLRDKEVRISMSEFAIIVLDEFILNRNTSNQMKALISSTDSKMRRAYGRFRESFKRINSFIATSNEECYIDQEEGNRRYLTIRMQDTKKFTPESLPLDGAYAQAYAIVLQDKADAYKATASECAAISKRNKAHCVPNVCEVAIPLFYRHPLLSEEGEMLTAAQILYSVNGAFKTPDMNAINVGKSLKRLGYHTKKTNAGTKYYVKRLTMDEIQQKAKEEGAVVHKEIVDELIRQQQEQESAKADEQDRMQSKIIFTETEAPRNVRPF